MRNNGNDVILCLDVVVSAHMMQDIQAPILKMTSHKCGKQTDQLPLSRDETELEANLRGLECSLFDDVRRWSQMMYAMHPNTRGLAVTSHCLSGRNHPFLGNNFKASQLSLRCVQGQKLNAQDFYTNGC